MEITISRGYLIILFILWIAPVVNAVWGGPEWVTVSFMVFFLIYAGHELIHAWICRINNLKIGEIALFTGGRHYILFELSDNNEINAKIYLAGVAYDSALFMVSSLNAIIFGLLTNDRIPVAFGFSLILIIISNLAWPNSDWQQYQKYSAIRA
jgi:hypothetical protein